MNPFDDIVVLGSVLGDTLGLGPGFESDTGGSTCSTFSPGSIYG